MHEPVIYCTCKQCNKEFPIDNMRQGRPAMTDEGVKTPMICSKCYPFYRATLNNKAITSYADKSYSPPQTKDFL